jgi:hypothetical protein
MNLYHFLFACQSIRPSILPTIAKVCFDQISQNFSIALKALGLMEVENLSIVMIFTYAVAEI